jgi:hypothetical protein
MAPGTNKTRAPSLRAFVVVYALLSLCVSDTVGPRLLPLPEAVTTTAADRHILEGADVTPAPTRQDTAVVRVAMAPPARKEAGGGRHTLHVTAGVVEARVRPPVEVPSSTWTTCSPASQSSAAVTRPPGRAPPLSV